MGNPKNITKSMDWTESPGFFRRFLPVISGVIQIQEMLDLKDIFIV